MSQRKRTTEMTAEELPEDFVDRIKEVLGEEELKAFLSSYDKPFTRALRLNPLKMDSELSDAEDPDRIDTLFRQYPSLGEYHLRPVPWAKPYGFYYSEQKREDENVENSHLEEGKEVEQRKEESISPGKSPLHEAGLYYIQDASAMAPSFLSGARPGEKILDLCAAPGGKTTMLASMMQGRGLLFANEIDPRRAKVLSANVERMGIPHAVVSCENTKTLAAEFPFYFDRVLVDAPCSGEGMFRGREQALSLWSREKVFSCARVQREILEDAQLMVKTGSILVYSTCTFSKEEDEETVLSFLERHPDFDLVDVPRALGEETMQEWGWRTGSGDPQEMTHRMIRLWPHCLEGEGHFIAVMKRKGERNDSVVNPSPVRRKNEMRSRTLPKEAAEFLKENLRVDILEKLRQNSESSVRFFGNEVYLMPYGASLPIDGLKILRAGLHLGTIKKNRFEPSHALAMMLQGNEAVRVVNVTAKSKEAAAFLQGEAIPCDPSLKGWTLVTVDGISMGWGKASGGVLKNHYPKGLRINS